MTPYISFRKRFILPIKYFLEEIGLVHKTDYPSPDDLLLRIEIYEKELTKCLQKNKRDEAKIFEIRLEELKWVYGSSRTPEHR